MSMSLEAGIDGDDDLFVVIVGDEDSKQQVQDIDNNSEVVKIKEEVLDEETTTMNIEELLATAGKHGELIDINDIKMEVLDETEFSENNFLDDDDDEEFVPDYGDEYSEEEYLQQDKVEVKHKRKMRRYMPDEMIRYKLRKPEERRSYVKEMLKQYPELREDKDLLIETLSQIMLNVKRPDPPQDYFMMSSDKFECVHCGVESETLPAASRHYQEKHGPRYLICFACGVDFRSTTNLYKHEKRCNSPDAVTVLKARARTLGRKGRGRPFLLSTEAIMQIKKQQKKEDKVFPCEECAAVYRSRQSLQAHQRAHAGLRPYRCALCPAAYTSSVALSRHKVKHTDRQFICDHCARPFKTKSALIVHLDTHKLLRKYACEECGRRYAQKMALTLHIDRDHRHLPPPCACQVCPMRFPRMSVLKQHMLKKHGMNLITRKMLYKALPLLPTTQVQQAKIVMKSEISSSPDYKVEQSEEIVTEESEPDLSKELKQYMINLKHGEIDSSTKFIVIHNGEAICVDGSNILHYKHNFISDVEDDLNNLMNIHEQQDVYEDGNESVETEVLNDFTTEVEETGETITDEYEKKVFESDSSEVKDVEVQVRIEQVISENKNVVAIKNSNNIKLEPSPKSKRVKLRDEYKKITRK